MPKKALLVSNTGWYLYNFRRPLARGLRAAGVEPVFVAPADKYLEKLRLEGYRCIEINMDRAGVNPFTELRTLLALVAIYRGEKPVVVHHFTIKCVVYGSLAANISGAHAVINAITGLGHVFVSKEWKAFLVRPLVLPLYRLLLKQERGRVIFQNFEDLAVFQTHNLIVPERTVLIRGSGVDLSRFSPRARRDKSREVVLLVARLLAEKGIQEFVEAARLLRQRGSKAVFQIAGDRDPGNPSSISEPQLALWKAEGIVEFLGHVEGIEALIAEATLVVLPSYREGLPRTLLEAAAMGKPIVTTDVPGCREVVQDGQNGYLVPLKDVKAFANAIAKVLENPQLGQQMGERGRKKVVAEFDEKQVIAATLGVYKSLGIL
ncbi:MAG: glycosyltransferase family 4 protein [Deltaproteobacteria bacterium]|nr:glycosyltransferase family 4 protein [Deltaproteobacteria bacterium]